MNRFKVPHTLVLLYGMILLAYLLTLVLPAGAFETITNDHGRDVVIPGTFALLGDVEALPLWSLFTVIPRGLESAQGIIFFVFLIGGALAVIRSTGVLDAALASPELSESSPGRQLHALPATRDDSIRVRLWVDLGTNQPGYAWFR